MTDEERHLHERNFRLARFSIFLGAGISLFTAAVAWWPANRQADAAERQTEASTSEPGLRQKVTLELDAETRRALHILRNAPSQESSGVVSRSSRIEGAIKRRDYGEEQGVDPQKAVRVSRVTSEDGNSRTGEVELQQPRRRLDEVQPDGSD